MIKIVFNYSPLIFLTRLNFLEVFLESSDEFYVPKSVCVEIERKQDEASASICQTLADQKIQVRSSGLISVVARLSDRLGKGESEAIALGLEIQTDYIILDDLAARREARRLGLNVKETLAIVKKLQAEGKIASDSLDSLYQQISEMNFRVKRSVFDAILEE